MSDAAAERIFNTAGAMRPEDHYCIPPLSRLGREELLTLIRRQQYFVLHAPRHTGKTSALRALRYLDRCGAAEGHLVIFDRTPDRPWEQKLFRREPAADAGPPITTWGM